MPIEASKVTEWLETVINFAATVTGTSFMPSRFATKSRP
jgi:hypothetical protein